MSIATQLTRLEKAKEDISAVITSNGGTVPSGTKLDGLAALLTALIGQIRAAADRSQIIATVESGSTVTLTNGKITKTATSTGTVIFKDLDFGAWKLTATHGKKVIGKTVKIDIFQIYYVALPYTADFKLDYPYDYAKP